MKNFKTQSRRVFTVFSISLLILSFQNCSKVGTSGIDVAELPGTASPQGDQAGQNDTDTTDTAGPDSSGGDSGSGTGTETPPSETKTIKHMVQDATVNESKKVDILFVIDNSGSMAYEQKNMASRVQNFISVVKGLDWQIGVTTTDPYSTTWGDGRLLEFSGLSGVKILKSGMDEATASNALAQTLQRSETGSGKEQGIYATYRVLERSAAETGFIRDGAQFAVVLISDEDESDTGFKNDPKNLMSYINTTYGGQKSFSFHSIITRPGDTACKSTNGAAEGFRYDQLSRLTGGVIGDVCAADYVSQVQGIAQGVVSTLQSITLACTPTSVNTIKVSKDGSPYSGTFQINGLNLVFDQALTAGQYQVEYDCYE